MAGYVRASQREAQLLDAAKAVLVRDGYEALSLRAVAGEAGVGLSTLQYVFRTRVDLVRALAARVAQDAGYSTFTPHLRGLRAELTEIAAWFGDSILADPGMRELLRAELVLTVARQRVDPADYPAGRPHLRGLLRSWLQYLQDEGNEVWAVPTSSLAALGAHAFTGLAADYLRNQDLEQYRSDVAFLVDALVAVADPRPAP